MSCIEIGVLLLSISVCRPDASPRRLHGTWVGTLGQKVLRAEFTRGALYVEGAGELTVLRAGESSSRAYLEAGDDFVLVGAFQGDTMVGNAYRAGEELPFELHREAHISPPRAHRSGTAARSARAQGT